MSQEFVLRAMATDYTDDHLWGPSDIEACIKAADEIRALRERLGPRGLEVVLIDGRGHYVNETVKAEIERLREIIRAGLPRS